MIKNKGGVLQENGYTGKLHMIGMEEKKHIDWGRKIRGQVVPTAVH